MSHTTAQQQGRSKPPPIPVRVIGFTPLRKGPFRGFTDIRIGRSLILRKCTVNIGPKGPWVGLPGAPVIRDGTHQRDAATGKLRYVPVCEWINSEARTAFNDAAVAALESSYPDAFDETYNDDEMS